MKKIRSNKEFNNEALEVIRLKAAIEQLTNEMNAHIDRIKYSMGDEEVVSTSDCTIHFSNVSSTRLDSKSFKKDMPELFAKYSKTTESRRFQICENN